MAADARRRDRGHRATRELLSDAADSIRRQDPDPPHSPDDPGPREPLRVLGFASNSVADELALGMLAGLLDDLPITIEITSARMQASDVVSLVQARGVSVVCFADLPPSPPAKTRYLVKRLHAALPDVRIVVGRRRRCRTRAPTRCGSLAHIWSPRRLPIPGVISESSWNCRGVPPPEATRQMQRRSRLVDGRRTCRPLGLSQMTRWSQTDRRRMPSP